MKLEEGKSFKFRYEKGVTLPDGSEFLVMNGPDGRKYLIPAAGYRSYGLKPGGDVVCRVDKINCKGEVFLEPSNPFYKEGLRYDFEVSGYRDISGSRIRQGRVMSVKTCTGEEVSVPVAAGHGLPAPGSAINLLVVRISKGKLHLSTGNGENRSAHLEGDRLHEFIIEGTETDIDGEEYFIVADELGVTHTMKRRYYDYYGFREGTRFRGRVVKYREDGTRMIEPENPFYTPGQAVEISITRNERNITDGSYYIAGTDRFGFTHELRVQKRVKKRSLLCRVVMIRKGKPYLVPDPAGKK